MYRIEFGRVCERGGVAHYDVDHLLQKQIVPDVVSFHDVAEINGCVKIFKVRLFCRRRLGEDAIGETGGEQPGIGASHINIDIWGRSQTVQNPIEVHKHPLAVVMSDEKPVIQ